jgi:hypothetical protein
MTEISKAIQQEQRLQEFSRTTSEKSTGYFDFYNPQRAKVKLFSWTGVALAAIAIAVLCFKMCSQTVAY